MSDPVENVDSVNHPADLTGDGPALSPDIGTDPGTPEIEIPDQATSVDSESQSDPVADAVATAVEQWIGFDPSIHAVNEDGTPRLKVDGTYARKRGKGGRKSVDDSGASGSADLFGDTQTAPQSGATATAPQTQPVQTAPNLSSQQAAAMLVIACTTVMGKLVGPEWTAEKAEQKALTDATKIYLDAKGGLNVTPEMGLFIALSMYAVPRLAHENTRSKFGLAVDWVRDRVAVLRARFSRAK